jgi:hypothetical protein
MSIKERAAWDGFFDRLLIPVLVVALVSIPLLLGALTLLDWWLSQAPRE